MSRSAEFGLGATFKDGDSGEQRSAISAVGGTRDNAQAKMLPPLENPPTTDPYYGVAGSVQGSDYDYEKRWSQSRDD